MLAGPAWKRVRVPTATPFRRAVPAICVGVVAGAQDDVQPGLVAEQPPGFAVGEDGGDSGPAAGVFVPHPPDVAFQVAGGDHGEDRTLGWLACPSTELARGLGQLGDQRAWGGEPAEA